VRTRRQQTFKIRAVSLSTCPSCGKPTLPHRACPACGNYGALGRVLPEKKKKPKKES
jgi:ribosomal protein L32